MKISKKEFESIVQEALDLLPTQFRVALDNLEILVEDLPDRETLEATGTRRVHSLLGLYSGVPLTERGTWYGMTPVTPDRITLFQNNIQRISRNREELKDQVLITVFHEIGHYFGMDEDQIRKAMKDFI
jgi:predicted Zn-dependent protease with MMP-like domain